MEVHQKALHNVEVHLEVEVDHQEDVADLLEEEVVLLVDVVDHQEVEQLHQHQKLHLLLQQLLYQNLHLLL